MRRVLSPRDQRDPGRRHRDDQALDRPDHGEDQAEHEPAGDRGERRPRLRQLREHLEHALEREGVEAADPRGDGPHADPERAAGQRAADPGRGAQPRRLVDGRLHAAYY